MGIAFEIFFHMCHRTRDTRGGNFTPPWTSEGVKTVGTGGLTSQLTAFGHLFVPVHFLIVLTVYLLAFYAKMS